MNLFEDDLFKQYLKKKDELDIVKIALTDKSYKDIYREKNHKELDDNKTNYELSTYGDSILKMCLMSIFMEKGTKKPTEQKKKYESDRSLVLYIAKKYHLLDFMLFNKNNKTESYEYDKYYKLDENGKKKKGNNNNHLKYIATCVEAMIAAIYIEESKISIDNAINKLITLFKMWIDCINNKLK